MTAATKIGGKNGNRRVFHILDENEPFSQYRGGAISRWVGNVARGDESSTVVCRSSDGSWRLPQKQLRVAPGYDRFSRIVDRVSLPVEARAFAGSRVLRTAIPDLSKDDVVWIHNRPEFCFALDSFVHSRGAQLVLHLHNSILEWKRDKMLRSLRLDRNVFVSRYLRDVTLQKFDTLGASSVIYNGSDNTLFYPAIHRQTPQNRPLSVIFASRLVPEKGAHILLGAVARLNECGIRLTVNIVGSERFGKTTTSDYIRSIRAGAPENVNFLGYRANSEVAELLRQADVFCLPSVWDDPFPLAPLEAMASGVPVIAARSGGIPEAFEWGGALLVEKNSIPQLTEAVKTLATNPDARRKLSQEGLKSFREHFTWLDVVRQFRSVAESL
ncbi:MAG TPA: glycosyltransferase family 4 protein [Bryobacteraceae bacterium]|jgi:glycosyltransferase involved in cell wall biosynthesis|nr:glycosyltransferase family 4 protein [Bryobacteraceae bacterium]